MRFLIKNLDKIGSDNLAFALGIGDSGEVGEEALRSIYANNIETQALIVAKHFLELVLAQHAVIDKYTGKIGSDSAVEQYGSNRRVDTTAETEYHSVVAELFFKLAHSALDERLGTPRTRRTADADGEILKQLHATGAVVYFGVELNTPHAVADAEGGKMHIGG